LNLINPAAMLICPITPLDTIDPTSVSLKPRARSPVISKCVSIPNGTVHGMKKSYITQAKEKPDQFRHYRMKIKLFGSYCWKRFTGKIKPHLWWLPQKSSSYIASVWRVRAVVENV
jgi:hypothetical protein